MKKTGYETVTFTFGPTTIACANTLKRIYQCYIPVIAFSEENIAIDVDTTSLRQEYLKLRISMIPIDNSKISGKVNPESITFEINAENKSKEFEMMDILGKDLVASDKKTYFDPKYMITQLKPGQKLHLIAKLKLFERRTLANRNNAHVHYTYDPEKHLGGGMYNFDFEIESYDSIPINDFIKLGKDMFVQVFQEYLDKFDNTDVFRFDPQMNKVFITTDDPHTVGNIVSQDIIVNYNDKKNNLDYCGYRQPHPTESMCEIRLESDTIDAEHSVEWMKKLVKDSLQRLVKINL